uniref:DEAD-box helicase OB fold domain-containing protein n=1 Tax=Eutreptiella gymnastica TaxID=73025 RepID=A0A7S1NQD1_9EUGL
MSLKSPFLQAPGSSRNPILNFSSGDSDWLSILHAYRCWQATGPRAEGSFCQQSGLSSKTLHMVGEVRQQLADVLEDRGLLQGRPPTCPDLNTHAQNIHVLKAVLCAGLMPNLCRAPVVGAERRFHCGPGTGSQVHVHHSSLNYGLAKASEEPAWLVFFEKVRTHRVYLRDTSLVPAVAVLLFGPGLTAQYREKAVKVHWARFVVSPRLAALVRALRRQLDTALEGLVSGRGEAEELAMCLAQVLAPPKR